MTADFFRANRARLGEKLSGGLIVLAANSRMQRSNDAAFGFEQEANFWYLTGIDEPDWKLIYDGTTHKSWLVMPEHDAVHAVFDGVLSADRAKEMSGVDAVLSHDELLGMYRQLARTHSLAYTIEHPSHSDQYNFALNPAIHSHSAQLERYFPKVQFANKELAKLRAIKQPEEIAAIRSAIKLTSGAFKTTHESMSRFRYEYEVEAEFTYHFRKNGAAGHAYDPIVATGINACTLHYIKNQSSIKQRQLVLIDIGARVDGYAADITRTYAKGQPTMRQAAVHAAVESAHKQIIQLLSPGLPVEEYQRSVDAIMFDAIASLGLNATSEQELVRRYMPHSISHGLGIDVHDSLGGPRLLQPGMVLTVEPGIYIPEESIGVRIEDDILITEKGATNLSGSLSTQL